MYGGFALRFSGVTINSTYGYAMSASGPPNVLPGVKGIKVFLDKCIFANNRWGLRMATVACLRYASLCSASTQTLVVKNSLFLGGNETRGSGEVLRFGVNRYYANLFRPLINEAIMLLENVTFQGLNQCALHASVQKNVKAFIYVKNCKFLNNSEFVYRSAIQIEFYEEDLPKCFKPQWNNGTNLRRVKQLR